MPRKPKPEPGKHWQKGKPPMCHVAGCGQEGVYKAPKSKGEIHHYLWYCLDHIRSHNQQWNFFAGMSQEEIEAFMQDALTGHRPTWARENHASRHEKLEDALDEFLHNERRRTSAPRALGQKLKNALGLLDIDFPYTAITLKKQYRILVKKYHPDLHKGDRKMEEKFKEITAAYLYLSQHLKKIG